MNSKLFTGLAVSAALLIGGPAFGFSRGGGGGGGGHADARPAGHEAVASSHRSESFARPTSVASVRRSPVARSFVAGRNTGVTHGAYAARRNNNATGNAYAVRNNASATRSSYASARNRSTNVVRNTASNRSYSRANRNSVAFGGHGNYATNGNNRRQYAFASHDGWNRDRQYNWHGHHYGWYNNGWYIIDPFPYYGYGYSSPDYGDNGGGVAVQVQSALQQAGYYQGPIDGIVGPGTSAAIAAYQRDNGLRVTGTITPGLVQNLGVG
jgi:hypothetical protein